MGGVKLPDNIDVPFISPFLEADGVVINPDAYVFAVPGKLPVCRFENERAPAVVDLNFLERIVAFI